MTGLRHVSPEHPDCTGSGSQPTKTWHLLIEVAISMEASNNLTPHCPLRIFRPSLGLINARPSMKEFGGVGVGSP